MTPSNKRDEEAPSSVPDVSHRADGFEPHRRDYGAERLGYGGSSRQEERPASDVPATEAMNAPSGGKASAEGEASRKGPSSTALRDDAAVCEDIRAALRERDDVDTTELAINVANGHVRLEGIVADRWMKFAIDEICNAVAGVQLVHNKLDIRPPKTDGPVVRG